MGKEIRVRDGSILGFQYEPGSGLRSRGIENFYVQINDEWTPVTDDQLMVAQGRFSNLDVRDAPVLEEVQLPMEVPIILDDEEIYPPGVNPFAQIPVENVTGSMEPLIPPMDEPEGG